MTVRHSRGQYEVVFTSLETALGCESGEIRIVTDRTVAGIAKGALLGRVFCPVEPGEQSKDLATYGAVLSWLAQSGASRRCSVVALGGGVVGDLAGFVAATYMRGVRFVQIPTTLLAMVDSSVGGKVGIDLEEGKNLAGAFKPPAAVYVPIELLNRLPDRQFTNGMAEVLKYGFIVDRELCEALATEKLAQDSPGLAEVVMRCIELKAGIVERDEFETTGERAILNFGHTIGHAIEQVLGYGELLHGEAIAIGMVLEAELGVTLGVTPPDVPTRVKADLVRYGLPVTLPQGISRDALVQAMRRDKKVVDGSLAFSLLTELGRCKIVECVAEEAVRDVLKDK